MGNQQKLDAKASSNEDASSAWKKNQEPAPKLKNFTKLWIPIPQKQLNRQVQSLTRRSTRTPLKNGSESSIAH